MMDGYKRISTYRAFLMGIAILWMQPMHLTFELPGGRLWLPVSFVLDTGYGGVDIFLFLSGFGLFCSLKADERTGRFFTRRLSRMLPAYLPAILAWIAIFLLFRSMTLPEALGNLFSVGWWLNMGNQLNWYTQAIFAFYLLAPLFYRAMTRTQHGGRTAALLMLAALAVGIPFIGHDQLLAASRPPVFLLGMYAGMAYTEGKTIKPAFAAVLYAAMAAGLIALALIWRYLPGAMVWKWGLWWYPFILITPGLCLLVTLVADALTRTKAAFLVRGVSAIGRCSYEIYLMHFIELQLLDWFLPATNVTRLALVVCSVATGMLYKRLVDAARRRVAALTICR